MIISHKHKFIFIHVPKTAGTSIEIFYAQKHKGEMDVISHINSSPELTQNNTGFFNPIPEIVTGSYTLEKSVKQFLTGHKYGPHQSAIVVKQRLGTKIWNSYFKFCIERNPFDKMVSRYFMSWGKSGTEREGKSFEDWVRRGTQFPHGYPMYTFRDKVIVDKIIRYENLNTELKEVFDHIGLPFDKLEESAHSKFRVNKNYKDFHTDYTRIVTESQFLKEMQLMGYSY